MKKAAKDYPESDIKKGDTYYHWKFKHGPKVRSKTYPKPSQLTRSEFYSTLLDIQDAIANIHAEDAEDLKSQVEDIASQLRELGESCQEKHDNMPDSLQDSETGELLTSRAEAMESAAEELDSIDLDDIPDEEELLEEVRQEIYEEIDEQNELVSEELSDIEIALTDLGKLGGLTEEAKNAAIQEELKVREELNEKAVDKHEEEIGRRVNDRIQEALQEKIEEVQNVSTEAE